MKKYDLLKTSWTYQTQEYFKNSTLHGVRYIAEEGRPFSEKYISHLIANFSTCNTCYMENFQVYMVSEHHHRRDSHGHNNNFPLGKISNKSDDNGVGHGFSQLGRGVSWS